MAKLTGNRLFYNFILIAVLLILLAVSLAGMDGVLTSVALEQDVCCGTEEHIHGADCYAGDILMCRKRPIPTGRTVIFCFLAKMTSTGCWMLWQKPKPKR